MKKITKRLFPALAALMMILMSLLMPIRASATMIATGSLAWVITSVLASVLPVAAANDFANKLDDDSYSSPAKSWAQDKISEWTYGYTTAQAEGKVFNAELTYGEMKQFADLLDQDYPDGSIQVSAGRVVDRSVAEDFPVTIPMDTDIYFTDTSQDGTTATTKKLYLTLENVDNASGYGEIVAYETVYSLPGGEILSEDKHKILSGGVISGETTTVNFNLTLNQKGALVTHLVTTWNKTGQVQSNDWYYTRLGILSDTTLISGVKPTFVPAEGVSVDGTTVPVDTDKLRDVPFGMTDDDIAFSTPVTSLEKPDDTTDKPSDAVDSKTGEEIIDNAPDVSLSGDFSNFKMPTGIASVFPFCLPVDFYNGIRLFAAQPKTPVFEFHIKIPMLSFVDSNQEYICDEVIKLDFGKYEKIGRLSRVLSTVGFLFCLIFVSTKIVKGAGA